MKKKLLQLFALLCPLAVQCFAQPQAIGLTLSATNGPSVDFTVRGYAPNGIADMQELAIQFGTTGGPICHAMLYQNQTILLLNDTVDGWTGWYPVGSASSTENSQCKLTSTSKQVISSTELWFSGHLEFKPAFNGTRAVSIWAANANWVSSRAWWTINSFLVSGTTALPTITSISPTNSGTNPTTFAMTATDAAGAADIQYISGSVGGHWTPYGCTWVIYRTGGKLLLNDAGGGWIGSPPFKNSQCEITGDSFATNGNNGTAGITITAQPGFSGAKTISGQAVNNANQYTISPNLGTWTIPTMQDQIIGYIKESPATLNPGEVNMSKITLSQAGEDLNTMALRVYHGNDPVTFRIRYARPNSQVWVTRIATVPAGAPSAGTTYVHTTCGPDNGQQNQGLQQAILDPVNGDNYGGCYLGNTDSNGYLEWTGRIWYGTAPATYGQYTSGMISAQFYIGTQVFNPNFPGITNGPMNEDNYVGALVYWVIGTDGYQGPAPY